MSLCLGICLSSHHRPEEKARSRQRPVGRAAATHRVKRRPHRLPPIRDARRDPGAQMRRPRAGARRCSRASPVRSDRMWPLPISPAAAIIYESIHSGALNGSVDSDGAVGVYRHAVEFHPRARVRFPRGAPSAGRRGRRRVRPHARVHRRRTASPCVSSVYTVCTHDTFHTLRLAPSGNGKVSTQFAQQFGFQCACWRAGPSVVAG